MRILIIDDSEYKVNRLVESIQKAVDCDITWKKARNSGCRALSESYVNDEPFDVLFLDMQMPVYDDSREINRRAGERILVEIERRNWNIPVVLISSDECSNVNCFEKIRFDSSVCYDETIKDIFERLDLIC